MAALILDERWVVLVIKKNLHNKNAAGYFQHHLQDAGAQLSV